MCMGGWSAIISVKHLCGYCTWWPEEGTGYSRNDITDGCDLPGEKSS